MAILALDLGVSKSVFCKFEACTGEYSLGNVVTHSGPLRKLFARHRPELVVVEICPQAGLVYDVAAELGIRTVVADTTQDAWKWRNVKRKTDQDDALKLARLAALDQLNPVYMPDATMRQWRRLITAREAAVAEQTRGKVRIRALLRSVEQPVPRGKSAWSQTTRTELRELARPLSACSPEELWRGLLELELERLEVIEQQLRDYDDKLATWAAGDPRLKLVATIPGVGLVTAATIVAVLDDPHRFRTRRQVAAYGGLAPRRFQSGQMDRQGRISKRGSAVLRRVLNQAAWMAIRHGPAFREFYLRLSGGGRKGKRKRTIVAVMHKLLVTAWAILRDQRPYHAREPLAAPTAA
jgi:transposase